MKSDLSLLDVIDKQTLQSLQDAFSAATGMAALATDDTGSVTEGSGFTDFCMNLTRKSKKGCERCVKCDLSGGAEASRTGRPAVYYCHGGLVDFAAPIIVNGKHIGSLIGGQVLTEEPDEAKFRKIAEEIDVDPDEYIAALRKIKIVPKKQVDAAANLMYQMANALSDVGYQRAVAAEESENMAKTSVRVSEHVATLEEKIEQTSQDMKALADSFSTIRTAAANSAKAVESTDTIVKTIENASTQLTLIGFNASIEAKRAGAAGAGFNVIAQEVRTLADKNTKQAGEIETTLNGIKKAMSEINAQIKAVNTGMEKTAAAIEELRTLIAETTDITGGK
ncbi:MAG: PocR ligand-binding domain-containing protein [Oscillospiraceae bacterium]